MQIVFSTKKLQEVIPKFILQNCSSCLLRKHNALNKVCKFKLSEFILIWETVWIDKIKLINLTNVILNLKSISRKAKKYNIPPSFRRYLIHCVKVKIYRRRAKKEKIIARKLAKSFLHLFFVRRIIQHIA